jgi:hypothetical protein
MPAHASAQRLLRVGLSLALVLLAAPLIELATHRSQLPAILGRYSRGYRLLDRLRGPGD